MGKKTSAAIGSAAQFMPQPDGVYQERLQGITGVKASAPETSDAKMVADSLGGAVGAYLDFSNTHRQKFEAEMDKAAQDMINSASQEEVEALNIVDMSQTYGYATLVDNPYWRAAVSRKAGERLMTTIDAQYNELYGDDRSLSMDDERKRYEDFVSSKQDAFLQKLPVDNQVAFMGGFNTRKTQSIQTLMDNRSQRDVADRLTEVVAATGADLSQTVANAAGMTREDVAKKASESFALNRLSNASPEARYKLAMNFINDLTKTGVFNSDDVLWIAENIPVATRLDGTTMPMSELIDTNAVREAATAYQASHMTQWALSLINDYKNDYDTNRINMDIAKLHSSNNPADRRKAEVLEGHYGQIQAQINENKRRRAAQQKAWAKQAKAAAKNSAGYSLWKANIQLALDGNHDAVDAFGNMEGVVRYRDGKEVPTAIRDQVLGDTIEEILSDSSSDYSTRLGRLANLMNYKGAESFVSAYQDRIFRTMEQIPKEQLSQGLVEGTYVNLYNMYLADPKNFGHAFGDKLTNAFTMIRNFAENSGYGNTEALAIGLNKWQDVSNLSQDQKNEYKAQCNSYFTTVRKAYGSAPDIDGIYDMSYGSPTSISFDDISRSDVAQDLVASYMAAGASVEQAVSQAGSDLRDNYVYKWGTVLPKTLFRDIYPNGTGSDGNAEYMGNWAINTFAYALTGDARYSGADAPNDGRVQATYDNSSGNILIYDTYTGASKTVSRDDLWNQMKWLATQG